MARGCCCFVDSHQYDTQLTKVKLPIVRFQLAPAAARPISLICTLESAYSSITGHWGICCLFLSPCFFFVFFGF